MAKGPVDLDQKGYLRGSQRGFVYALRFAFFMARDTHRPAATIAEKNRLDTLVDFSF